MFAVFDQRGVLYEGSELMKAIGTYLMTLTGAALICAFATKMPIKGVNAGILRMICGVFIALVVISPLISIKLESLDTLTDDIWSTASQTTVHGENIAKQAMAELIKEKTQAYILDKAADLGVCLNVIVSVSSDDLPVPDGVQLAGDISPYAKSVLTEYIEQQLGIDRKEQIWIQP